MTTLKITAAVKDDMYQCEYHTRADRPNEPEAMKVYSRIADTKSTRKDGSISIEVSEAELDELYREAEYSGDSTSAVEPGAGYIRAWAGLKRQIEKARG